MLSSEYLAICDISHFTKFDRNLFYFFWIKKFVNFTSTNTLNGTNTTPVFLKKCMLFTAYFKVTLTSQKICFICFNEIPLKVMKSAFCFILKALFVFKIFRLLFRLFGQKTALLERLGSFQNLRRHNLLNKPLQYTYCSISYEVKETRQ